MEMIDTHIHIWDLQKARYEWLEGDTSVLNRTYRIEELTALYAEAGVSKGLLVQAANHLEDNRIMSEAVAGTDWLCGFVGWLPLEDPTATEKMLTAWLKNKDFKGCRHLIHTEADPEWLLQDGVIESLSLLAQHDLPYDVVGVIPAHLEAVLKVSDRLPQLRMVLDHLNQPPIAGKERFGRWGQLMKEVAARGNIYAKISGLGTSSGNFQGWTQQDLQPYIEFALEYFGADRCFCGGDWPVSLLAGSYISTWDAYKTIIMGTLDEADQYKVFYKNAEEFYGL